MLDKHFPPLILLPSPENSHHQDETPCTVPVIDVLISVLWWRGNQGQVWKYRVVHRVAPLNLLKKVISSFCPQVYPKQLITLLSPPLAFTTATLWSRLDWERLWWTSVTKELLWHSWDLNLAHPGPHPALWPLCCTNSLVMQINISWLHPSPLLPDISYFTAGLGMTSIIVLFHLD